MLLLSFLTQKLLGLSNFCPAKSCLPPKKNPQTIPNFPYLTLRQGLEFQQVLLGAIFPSKPFTSASVLSPPPPPSTPKFSRTNKRLPKTQGTFLKPRSPMSKRHHGLLKIEHHGLTSRHKIWIKTCEGGERKPARVFSVKPARKMISNIDYPIISHLSNMPTFF